MLLARCFFDEGVELKGGPRSRETALGGMGERR